MGQKFESELARKVADGNKDNSSKKKGVLFAAVATCALLFGSAAFSIAAADNDNGTPVTVLQLVSDQVDELTVEPGIDVDVKRVMNLKARSFSPLGDSGCTEYTKFVYSVKVMVNDSGPIDGGATVGILTIDYEFSDDVDATKTVFVNGVEPDVVDSFVSIGANDGKTQVVVSLPAGDYSEGSVVYFNVSVRLPGAFWDGDVTEEPWPGLLDDLNSVDIDWPEIL